MEKERFKKEILKHLSEDQKILFSLISVEQQKETIIFRMPVDLIALDSVWEVVERVSKEHDVKVKQAGQYATLEELDDLLGDVEWLWKPWIPKGFVTMVAGDPGIGKSAIVQWLVKIITEGSSFPMDIAPLSKLGTAIWVDTEASQLIIKSRANSMKMDKKRIFLPVINGDILAQANLGFKNDREMIIDLVTGTQADILVLDSLGGSHTKGENRVEDIRPVLEFLTLLARDYKIAVVVVHHLNKGHKDESPEVSLYRIRGSTIIPAMCRSIFAVEKSHDGNNLLRMVKNNLAKPPTPILVLPEYDEAEEEIVRFNFKYHEPPPAKKSKRDKCVEWVFEQLGKTKHGASPTTLVEWSEGEYTRQMIYSARRALGGKIVEDAGKGNEVIWNVAQREIKDTKNIQKVLSSVNGKHKTKSPGGNNGRKKAK